MLLKGAKYAKATAPTTLLTLIEQGYDPDLEVLLATEEAIEAATKPVTQACAFCGQTITGEHKASSKWGTVPTTGEGGAIFGCPANTTGHLDNGGGYHSWPKPAPTIDPTCKACGCDLDLGQAEHYRGVTYHKASGYDGLWSCPESNEGWGGHVAMPKMVTFTIHKTHPAKAQTMTHADKWLDAWKAACVLHLGAGEWEPKVSQSYVSDSYLFEAYLPGKPLPIAMCNVGSYTYAKGILHSDEMFHLLSSCGTFSPSV